MQFIKRNRNKFQIKRKFSDLRNATTLNSTCCDLYAPYSVAKAPHVLMELSKTEWNRMKENAIIVNDSNLESRKKNTNHVSSLSPSRDDSLNSDFRQV